MSKKAVQISQGLWGTALDIIQNSKQRQPNNIHQPLVEVLIFSEHDRVQYKQRLNMTNDNETDLIF